MAEPSDATDTESAAAPTGTPRAGSDPTPPLPRTDPVLRAVEKWLAAGNVDPAAPIVVACSGGADSLALAAAVLAATSRTDQSSGTPPRTVVAAIVDHGLQENSALVAQATAEVLRAMGYRRVEVLRVRVGTDGGMEAAARGARYEALRAVAQEVAASEAAAPEVAASEAAAPKVVTQEAVDQEVAADDAPTRARAAAAVLLAHTADDQAETVLLGLGRGSGPRSVAGMSPWTEPWGRPLLAVRRSDTENACATIGVEPWIDPHNANPAFTRVRIRREVLPLLDEVLSGGTIPALARTAELMADDLAALDAIADRSLAEALRADGLLDCALLATWPSAVRRRALRTWAAQEAGITTLTYQHLVALEEIVIHGRSRWAVRLPGGIDATRRGTLLTLAPATPPSAPGSADAAGGMAG